MTSKPAIAVLGGTGKEGRGLAYRWAKAGFPVLIGSRSEARAKATAAMLRERLGPAAQVEGYENREAARRADVVVVSVPYAGMEALAHDIRDVVQGKLVLSAVVPLKPPKVYQFHLPEGGSAAQTLQAILGPETPVVDAFQHISHELLWEDGPIDGDVLVAGTGRANRERAIALIEAMGLRAIDAGPLENCTVVEGLTSLLIYINRRYQTTHAGIRITGLPESPSGRMEHG